MRLEQTVAMPSDRHIRLDLNLPETFTSSAVRIVIMPAAEQRSWRDFCGVFKTDGHDVEHFLEETRADKINEMRLKKSYAQGAGR
jgi:hypothetical protein